MAGLRIATVSTVAMTTVGAVVGYGGLGNLIYAGRAEHLQGRRCSTASVLCVLLALAADLLLLGLQRLLTPWTRSPRRAEWSGDGSAAWRRRPG